MKNHLPPRLGAPLLAVLCLMAIGNFLPAFAQESSTAPVALTDMSLGNADAPVTMIEYASVTCGHCAAWNKDVYPEIYERYIKTGKVRFVVREFPRIPGHPVLVPRSYAGTMLARCAAEQNGTDSYFDVLKTLFAKQQEWAFGQDARGELLKIANEVQLDEAAFDACIQRDDIKDHLDQTMRKAESAYNIASTPSFVINGEVKKVYSIEEITTALDAALSNTP